MKEKPYLLIYRLGDNTVMEKGSAEFIKQKINKLGLESHEYGIVEGKVVKSFATAFSLIGLK
jgi:hypothetical protein